MATNEYKWNEAAIKVVTRIQLDELRNTWMHNRMYEHLNAKNDKLGWIMTILSLVCGILGFLLASIQNTSWQTAGGIISGITGIVLAFISRQSERLALSSNAESHRLIAASHSGLYDEIELMLVHPTQPHDVFISLVKTTLKGIRDNSSNLVISDDVKAEWTLLCKQRNIHIQYDTFDQLNIIVSKLSTPTHVEDGFEDAGTIISEQKQQLTTSTFVDPTIEQSNQPNQTQQTQQTQSKKEPEHEPGQETKHIIRDPGTIRGYNAKTLALELDRMANWTN